MPDISTFEYNGVDYQIKDSNAREFIDGFTNNFAVQRFLQDVNDWDIGQISWGGATSGNMQNRLRTKQYLDPTIQMITIASPYTFIVGVWDNNNKHIGYWLTDNTLVKSADDVPPTASPRRTGTCFLAHCPDVTGYERPYKFKLMLRKDDNSNFTKDVENTTLTQVADAIQNLGAFCMVDSTLTVKNAIPPADIVGAAINTINNQIQIPISIFGDSDSQWIHHTIKPSNGMTDSSRTWAGYYDQQIPITAIREITIDPKFSLNLACYEDNEWKGYLRKQNGQFSLKIGSDYTELGFEGEYSITEKTTRDKPVKLVFDDTLLDFFAQPATKVTSVKVLIKLYGSTSNSTFTDEVFAEGINSLKISTSCTMIETILNKIQDSKKIIDNDLINLCSLPIEPMDWILGQISAAGVYGTTAQTMATRRTLNKNLINSYRIISLDPEHYAFVVAAWGTDFQWLGYVDLTADNCISTSSSTRWTYLDSIPELIALIETKYNTSENEEDEESTSTQKISKLMITAFKFATTNHSGSGLQFTNEDVTNLPNIIKIESAPIDEEEVITWKYSSSKINPYKDVDFNNDAAMQRINSIAHLHINSAGNFKAAYNNNVRHFAGLRYHPSVPPIPDYSEHSYDTGSHIFDYSHLADANDIIISPGAEHPYTSLLNPVNFRWENNSNIHILAPGSTDQFGFDFPGRPNSTGDIVLYKDKYTDRIMSLIDHLPFFDAGGIIITHPAWTSGATHFEDFDVARFIEDCLDFHPLVLGTDVIESGRLRQINISNRNHWEAVDDNNLTQEEKANALTVKKAEKFTSTSEIYYYTGQETNYVTNSYYKNIGDWRAYYVLDNPAINIDMPWGDVSKIINAKTANQVSKFTSKSTIYYYTGSENGYQTGFYKYITHWAPVLENTLTADEKEHAVKVTRQKDFTSTSKVYYIVTEDDERPTTTYYKVQSAQWEPYQFKNLTFEGEVTIWDKSLDNQNLVDHILAKGKRCWMYGQGDWTGRRGCNELLVSTTTPVTILTTADSQDHVTSFPLTPEEKSRQCLKAYRYGNFFARLVGADKQGNLSPLKISAINFDDSGDLYTLSISTPTTQNGTNLNVGICIVTITEDDIIKEYSTDSNVNAADSGLTLTIENNIQTFSKTNIPKTAKAVRAFAFIEHYAVAEDNDWPYYILNEFLTNGMDYCSAIREVLYNYLYQDIKNNDSPGEFAVEIKKNLTALNLNNETETNLKTFIRNYRLDNYKDVVFTNPILLNPATTRTFIPAYGR